MHVSVHAAVNTRLVFRERFPVEQQSGLCVDGALGSLCTSALQAKTATYTITIQATSSKTGKCCTDLWLACVVLAITCYVLAGLRLWLLITLLAPRYGAFCLTVANYLL